MCISPIIPTKAALTYIPFINKVLLITSADTQESASQSATAVQKANGADASAKRPSCRCHRLQSGHYQSADSHSPQYPLPGNGAVFCHRRYQATR